ncbi:MAG: hypothetical protein ABIA76_04495 [Candidatus Diapherotrites archaeon]
MKTKTKILILLILSFFFLVFSGSVSAETASERACYKQCLYDAGWREDKTWMGSINIFPGCTLRCCEGFCCSKCWDQCKDGSYQMTCVENCEYECFKEITGPCRESCEAKDPNSDYLMIDGKCSCMCANGYHNSGGTCVEGKKPANESCLTNYECGNGLFCFKENCISSEGTECTNDNHCGTGSKCVEKKCVGKPDQPEDECKSYSDCEEGEECENGKCVSKTLGLSLQINPTEVMLKQGQPVTITASVSGPKRASVTFDINDPDFLFSQGKLTKRKSIDDSGKAQITINFPAFNQIGVEKRDYLPYSMAVTVTATSGDQSATANGNITLVSPAPKITSVEIKPTPVKAYGEYLISVQIEDPDSSEFQYFFKAITGEVSELEDSSGASKTGMLLVDSSSKSASVNYFSDEIGFNANEILMAQEMEGTLAGGAKSLGFSAAKYGGEKLAEKTFKSKFFLLLQKRGAKYVPVIGTVKTLYGMWGNMKSSGQKFMDLLDSANWKEGIYRGLDLTAEGAKFTAGAADLLFGEVPVIGNLADLTQDSIDMAVTAGQGYLKQLAEEERFEASELRTTPNFVTIKVRDKDGFMDSETLTFDLQYHWVES